MKPGFVGHLIRIPTVACTALAIFLTVVTPFKAQNPQISELDTTVKPGDDFYRYANGGWLKSTALPEGAQSFDTRAILRKRTNDRVRGLIEQAASAHAKKGSLEQKVGDYYASLLDLNTIETKQLGPVLDPLAAIDRISSKSALSAYLGATLSTEVDGLTANADHVFGLWVAQSFHDAKRNVPHLWQGGLGMDERESYLDASPKGVEARAQYQARIAKVLKLAGVFDPETRAAGVMSLEVKLARAHAPDSDAADNFKQDNPWRVADFATKAPGMDWRAYFRRAGIADQPEIIVWQPSAVVGTSALVANAPLPVWRDYLRYHLFEHYANALPFAFARDPQADRQHAAITATNGALGHAVGQLYVRQYFPPSAKAKAQAMVADLLAAYRQRIANVAWMSAETKKRALAKLDTLVVGVGYPDEWIDYSKLEVVRGDAFGNVRRAELFRRAWDLAQLKRPADPGQWRIEAQSFGAIIMFTPNAEFFSAGLLQPPFFEPDGDTASNYGSAGAGMAHESTHVLDELGNIYDEDGRLAKWWTEQDRVAYHAAAAKLVNQLSGYCPFADACVKGEQVLGESSADLAGLAVAHDAYLLSLHGRQDAVINGLTGEQRFYLAFAQRWRVIQSEAAARHQVATDTHLPGEYRSDSVRNMNAWYDAYGVTTDGKLYLAPEQRVQVW